MPRLRDSKDQLGSPYLLEHADNPVDWWSWGEDALAFAARHDRPVFLSVGYASCHWCHVMAHESFEDPGIAQLLNDSFVSIKVDREERPDVDALYMAATQLSSGHGGWPMSVFLLPDGRPFMAGTYYPREDRDGQVGFARLLRALANAWRVQRDAVVEQAAEIHAALQREIAFVDHLAPQSESLDLAAARARARRELLETADVEGGFGPAPKFPRPSLVEVLLESGDDDAAAAAQTLDAMSRRGLYDHVRGGFARYSVDSQWHVPHFEKMLSDQALLARTYLHAWRAWPEHDEWRAVALDTLRFVVEDLGVAGGYASSLDADAGGVEGSHVTWTVDEVRDALARRGLAGDLDRVLARWRIASPGAFEGRSIPRLGGGEPFTTPPELAPALEALRAGRATRPQPRRDEKVLLEWNAMFASACLKSGEPRFVELGLGLLDSLAASHAGADAWYRTQRRDVLATAGDLAWLVDACVDAFEQTGADHWLARADEVADYLLAHHWDGPVPSTREPGSGAGLFTQSDRVTDLPARPKEIFDGATPSSHAVACRALSRLALCRGDQDRLAAARRLVDLGATLLVTHPNAVPDLLLAAGYALDGVEIVVPGGPNELSELVRLRAVPRSVLVTGHGASPLLVGRTPGQAYVCRAGVCQLPASTPRELDEQLRALG
jgi:uncharacterized protein